MSCGVASWLPAAVGETLCDEINKPALIAWLGIIRDHAEEYEVLPIAIPPPSPPPSPTENNAFDEILSQLGKEIYQLEEYQRNFSPPTEEAGLSQSILELFEECLCEMTSDSVNSVVETNRIESESIYNLENECDSDQTSLSYETSSPIKEVKMNGVNKVTPPIPPPRVRLKTPSSASSIYDNIEFPKPTFNGKGDSDSESTCWSYKECGDGSEKDDMKEYAELWSHSSGFGRSDDIIRKVVAQHQAKESRISFHTASEWTPAPVSVYSLASVDSVVDMTPQNLDDGYEPVRDALPDENIYEEIEYLSYTDEGCSCVGSLEVESCSVSASSESESPVYANLQDNDAYAIPADVIAWKNLLLDPFYNDDEEDEWITPEECAVYTREQRPPLVIPRITQYRPPRHERRPHNHIHCYPEESLQDTPAPMKSSVKPYERQDWTPNSDIERGFGKSYESPLYTRMNKKLSGSTENLLSNNTRRPNQLNLPASSSGDSLDVEIRDIKEPNRDRKSRSMVAAKQRVWSPIPAPRMLVPQPAEAAVICEGPMKRTKFSDKGKKCKKNWTECYMILTTTALVFYKDQKTYYATKIPKPPGTPPSPNAPRAELVLPLKSAHAVPCIEQHTRRYRRSINLTVDYDAYLLQDDTDEGSKQWLNRIQAVIYRLGPPTSEYLQIQSSNTDLESLGRTPPVSRHHTKKPKAGGSSNEDLSDTTEVSHVRSILRKFFTKRPAMEVLVKKGIYKDEPVFGRNLEEVCPNISPRVPDFVVACITEIEKDEENMTTDGLYRASGNLSQVQKIRLEIDQNNMSVLENYPDIHVLTGSLKLFFRELKEPLIPCKLFDRVLSACSIKPKEAKIKEFRDIVHALPQCNRETLKYLLEHLLRVTTYSERNRMHTANLAIVFGPTLLWAPMEQAHNIAIDCIQQNNVVDILLTDFKEIFAEENIKGKKKS